MPRLFSRSLIHPETSLVEIGLLVGSPDMSGAGMSGKPSDKAAPNASRTTSHTEPQFSKETPIAGATAARRPPRQAFAALVL